MFGPWVQVFVWLKNLWPGTFRFDVRKLNFITLHYTYIIGLTIVGSIILYPAKNMPYIDALFFASGSATQSGLNTIDVNLLFLYQQIAIVLISCISNPIFINTVVVFVRLYWFEKRFKSIVLEAQNNRRSKDGTRTRSELPLKQSIDYEEKGIGNHNINAKSPWDETSQKAENIESNESSDNGPGSMSRDTVEGDSEILQNSVGEAISVAHPFRFGSTPADEIKSRARQDADIERMPMEQNVETHIAFVENQRQLKDNEVLYIPGPREFDRGDVPQRIEVDIDPLDSTLSRMKETSPDSGNHDEAGTLHTRDQNTKTHISFGNSVPAKSRADHRAMFDIYDRGPNEGKSTREKKFTIGPIGKADEQSPMNLRKRSRSTTFTSLMSQGSQDEINAMPYLSYQPTIGRNSTFINLSREQRAELGGIEYRALKTLTFVLCSYYVGFLLLGIVCFVPWILLSQTYGSIPDSDGVSRVWWGIFTPPSMFNDVGYTLTPDSMISFANAIFPLLLGSFLIIIGNTGFPCMLRLVIWILLKITPRRSAVWEEFSFLLDHPRRCFTLLFPGKATWWLFWVLFVLNGVDLMFFIILDLNDPVVTILSPGIRVVDGWFQAVSTRTSGLAVVNIALLHPAIQVSYLVMMYISVFPIAISVRNTNVYEEKSLGIWGGQDDGDKANEQSLIGAHLRRQLSFDLWFVFLGLFLIAIIEGPRIQDPNDVAFSLFAVLFEIVSAYGTVGLSLGYPNINASFSAEFNTLSKLIIIAMEIRGRHRGLPYALDRAILLPSEELHQKEHEDDARRLSRTQRRNSNLSALEPTRDVPETGGPSQVPSGRDLTHSEKAYNQRSGLSKLISGVLSAGPIPEKMRDD